MASDSGGLGRIIEQAVFRGAPNGPSSIGARRNATARSTVSAPAAACSSCAPKPPHWWSSRAGKAAALVEENWPAIERVATALAVGDVLRETHVDALIGKT
jgi:hypothetical protein